MVMFSSVGRKDTVHNIAATGEFALSLASRRHATAMNLTSQEFEVSVDEFDCAGLERMASSLIRPPGVVGSPAIMECRSVELRQLTTSNGRPLDTWLVIGEILAVQIRQDCIENELFRTELANPILRAGYTGDFWEIQSEGKFLMDR